MTRVEKLAIIAEYVNTMLENEDTEKYNSFMEDLVEHGLGIERAVYDERGHNLKKINKLCVMNNKAAGLDKFLNAAVKEKSTYKFNKAARILKRYNCPVCGKELLRLDISEDGEYDFWCDKCNLDITIIDNKEYRGLTEPGPSITEDSLYTILNSLIENSDDKKVTQGIELVKDSITDFFTNKMY